MKSSPEDCNSANRWLKFFKKWHRWPGLILGLFFIFWSISGIVMNHRQLFSSFDISRKYLPQEHRFVNWNNAAVKSGVKIGADSLLIYGNIGIWLTDTNLSCFTDFNAGFPEGIDNRKISSMLVTPKGTVYAGTLFGLFYYDFDEGRWDKLTLPVKDERIQWLEQKDESLLILTRSELWQAKDDPKDLEATLLHLPPPAGYDDKAGLFRTIWVIHSGEIYGIPGKLIVDALGLIVISLAITGLLHFAMPYALRRLKKKKKPMKQASEIKRFSAKWHNTFGVWIFIFILINTVTGMFLRPPLLITIANARVGKIPFSLLDTPNPWDDKLRAIIYDKEISGYILGTNEGLFYADEGLKHELIAPSGQPPLSVMGINVFMKRGHGHYLVGTFNGLYDWLVKKRDGVPRDGVPGDGVPGDGVPGDGVPGDGVPRDHFSGKVPNQLNANSKPFGNDMISGYLVVGKDKEISFDYNRGAEILTGALNIPPMPEEILRKSPMSWWNFSLEVHTGRIFKPLTGDFYILFVPLMGIFGTLMVIAGLVIWIKLFLRKRKQARSKPLSI